MPLDKLGVSIHWLKTGFLQEVLDAGLGRNSKIYEIENLHGPPGVIRKKGANVFSCVDQKLGASYVHCLSGIDNVGQATFMLSYGWGYTIGDIIDTLESYCQGNGLNLKRTYVWICCLCVNQHRVVEEQQQKQGRTGASGMITSSSQNVDFFAEFSQRVTGIGHILCMMAPWNNPLYLRRVWCIFEIHTAHRDPRCDVTIVMPPAENWALQQSLFNPQEENKTNNKGVGYAELYQALANTKIEAAQASVESDRIEILKRVQQEPGGYPPLNEHVNELLRHWVRTVIHELITTKESTLSDNNQDHDSNDAKLRRRSFAVLCLRVGNFLGQHSEYEESMFMLRKGLSVWEMAHSTNKVEAAEFHRSMGSVLKLQAKWGECLNHYRKAQSIYLVEYGENHVKTGQMALQISTILGRTGDLTSSINQWNVALKTLEANQSTPSDNEVSSESFSRLGGTFLLKNDTENAQMAFQQAMAMSESSSGENGLDTARSYYQIGQVLKQKGELNEALVQYQKCLAARNLVLGKDHSDTVEAHLRIGETLAAMQNYKGAVEQYRIVVEICEASRGGYHADTAKAREGLAGALNRCGCHKDAIAEYRKCQNVYQALEKDHPDVARLETAIKVVRATQLTKLFGSSSGRHSLTSSQSRSPRRSSLVKSKFSEQLLKTLNADQKKALRSTTTEAREFAREFGQLGLKHQEEGDFEASSAAYLEAIAIQERVLGQCDPDTGCTYNNFGSMLGQKGDFGGAIAAYRKALVHTNHDPLSTAMTRVRLGRALHSSGALDEARDEFQKALDYFNGVVSARLATKDTHLKLVDTYRFLADVLKEQGNVEEATLACQRARARLEQILGKEPCDVICPKEHRADLFLTYHTSFRCDQCHLLVPLGAPMYGCRTCNWDVCDICREKMSSLQPKKGLS